MSMKIPNLSDDEFKALVTDKDVDDMLHEVFLIEDKQPIQIDIPMSDVWTKLLNVDNQNMTAHRLAEQLLAVSDGNVMWALNNLNQIESILDVVREVLFDNDVE